MTFFFLFSTSYLSSKSHLGGTKENNELGDWISDQFKLAELDNIQVAKYDVLVSYPRTPGIYYSLKQHTLLQGGKDR